MARRPTALERTAYHEAGHVVFAHAVGRRMLYATIEADAARTALAGSIAERDFVRRADHVGAASDYAAAAEIAMAACGSERQATALVQFLQFRVEDTFATWRPAIRAVAHALLAEKQLGRARITTIINGSI